MFGFITASLSREKKLYKSVKNILGFYPGNIFLYRLAFRHKSASRVVGNVKSNNERLEYLGDSVISTAVAHYLFKRYPNKDEGFLTEMRSKMVSRATLNKVAVKMGLHELLNIDSKSGGFKSVDGNALEALMGAVFLDKGYKFTEKIILRRIVAVHIDMDEIESRDWNYKSKLIDWGQKERFKVNFQVLSTMQQKGKKLYKVAAMVNSEVWGEGMDQSIKAAEQIAAENAYKNRVIPFIDKQSKKGYREPVVEDIPVSTQSLAKTAVPGSDAVPASEDTSGKTSGKRKLTAGKDTVDYKGVDWAACTISHALGFFNGNLEGNISIGEGKGESGVVNEKVISPSGGEGGDPTPSAGPVPSADDKSLLPVPVKGRDLPVDPAEIGPEAMGPEAIDPAEVNPAEVKDVSRAKEGFDTGRKTAITKKKTAYSRSKRKSQSAVDIQLEPDMRETSDTQREISDVQEETDRQLKLEENPS